MHDGPKIDYTVKTMFFKISAEEVFNSVAKSNSTETGNTSKGAHSTCSLNISVPQMELLSEQYSVPKLVEVYTKGRPIHKVNLWVYLGNREADWHFDGHDNFVYVLEGKKTFYLAPYEAFRSQNAFSLYNNHRYQNGNDGNTQIYKETVMKGRCLYLPRGWWHKV
jgi:hypothetical protein